MSASRAAKSSQRACLEVIRLSHASKEFSETATLFLAEAQQAKNAERFLQFACLELYRKWLFYRAAWHLGKAMQLGERADEKFEEAKNILDKLGITIDGV